MKNIAVFGFSILKGGKSEARLRLDIKVSCSKIAGVENMNLNWFLTEIFLFYRWLKYFQRAEIANCMSTQPLARVKIIINWVLTDNSILLEAMQQAGGELLNVHGKSRTVFNSSYQFDQHFGCHWQSIIAGEKFTISIAYLQVWGNRWLCIEGHARLRQTWWWHQQQ